MPAGKQSQSNAMLYTVITFVGLFLVATVLAVIFYVKTEDYKTAIATIKQDIDKLATTKENRELTDLIGKPTKGKSYLGTMIEYLDDMVSAITGQILEGQSASSKVNSARQKVTDTMQFLDEDASAAFGPEGIDLLQTIVRLKTGLDDTRESAIHTEQLLEQEQDNFKVKEAEWLRTEKKLRDNNAFWREEANNVQANYDTLKAQLESSKDEQIRLYMDRLDEADKKFKDKNMELLTNKAKLNTANTSLQEALDMLEKIKPRPNVDVAAFLPDARIIDIDLQAMVVYLDIGSDDHVYKGLTFSIYDENVPIPEDGKPKAEIEVFDIEKDISIARINNYSKKKPIVPQNIVANLIWDSKANNTFVIAGDFDFNDDGYIDFDGAEKIEQLIKRWGGRIVDEVTIKTDFIVLGEKPKVLPKPSRDIIDIDPMAEQKYLVSLQLAQRYQNILDTAATLRVPVFNQRRFMRLIGYQSLATKTSTSK